jgi:hypothetical protein
MRVSPAELGVYRLLIKKLPFSDVINLLITVNISPGVQSIYCYKSAIKSKT